MLRIQTAKSTTRRLLTTSPRQPILSPRTTGHHHHTFQRVTRSYSVASNKMAETTPQDFNSSLYVPLKELDVRASRSRDRDQKC